MTYRVEIRSRVLKQIQKLPPPLQQRLSAAIDALATEPKPPGSTKLVGERRMWRIKLVRAHHPARC